MVTNSHLAACWNFLTQRRKDKAMLYFVWFKDPLTPKNGLSQRSRWLRIQHWHVVFTQKQNKTLCSHRLWKNFGAGDATWLLKVRLDHNVSGRVCYVPQSVTAPVRGQFFLSLNVPRNAIVTLSEGCGQNKTVCDTVERSERFTEPATRLPA